MKTLFKTAICLSALLMAASCVLDKIDSQPAADPRLECDALDSYTIQANKPQDISFRVSATTPWSITGFEGASWLTVEPASSAVSSLSEDIRIKATANPDLSDRSVTLTLKGENTSTTQSITITQLRKGKLVVMPIAEDFAMGGNTLTFKVESNLDWAVSAADEWLTFSPASGTGDGTMKSFNVNATAAANGSITRTTTVTVTSGDEKFEFTAKQKGQSLEFGEVENTELDRTGQEVILDVDATMDWTVSCDNADFTVTKEGNNKVKVVAPWNNKFAARSATVTIKPTSSSYGDVSSSVTFTQDVNFTLSGHCEVLADGSVKIYGDDVSRVKLIDGYRYASIIIKMGDKGFADNAQMWLYANDAVEGVEVEIQNQIQLGKRVRVRLNGDLPNSGLSTYDSVDYDMTKDELNKMDEYRVDILPSENSTSGVGHLKFSFSYNGTLRSAVLDKPSIFEDVPEAACHYWFGCYSASNDGTWYVVKSCDVVPVEE
ncbi:MAG: BACON domain-containing protein [Bacteroidales bacterium]|nr:BACON domain-containing protein [Bacteroidales bacterium]